jgi:photosystem II stability/assembly factor-like uncharacterized protein
LYIRSFVSNYIAMISHSLLLSSSLAFVLLVAASVSSCQHKDERISAGSVKPTNNENIADVSFPAGLKSLTVINEYEWLAGDYSGIWRTSDAGKAWNKVFPTDRSENLPSNGVRCLNFTSSADGFSVFDNRVLKTTDGGKTWDEVSRLDVNFSAYGCHFSNEIRGQIIGTQPSKTFSDDGRYIGKILESIDGGRSWQAVELTDVAEIASEKSIWRDIASSSGNIVIIGGDPGVVLSRDDGQSWRHVPVVGQELAIEKAWALSPEILIVKTARSNNYFLSRNAGSSWHALPFHIVYGDLVPSFLAVSDHLIFAALTRVYRTSNFGKSWQEVAINTDGYSDLQMIRGLNGALAIIAFHPVTHKALAYFSTDNGSNWTRF